MFNIFNIFFYFIFWHFPVLVFAGKIIWAPRIRHENLRFTVTENKPIGLLICTSIDLFVFIIHL